MGWTKIHKELNLVFRKKPFQGEKKVETKRRESN